MPENTLKKIKSLSKQNEETLNDALGLAMLLDSPMEWIRWIRKDLSKTRYRLQTRFSSRIARGYRAFPSIFPRSPDSNPNIQA